MASLGILVSALTAPDLKRAIVFMSVLLLTCVVRPFPRCAVLRNASLCVTFQCIFLLSYARYYNFILRLYESLIILR